MFFSYALFLLYTKISNIITDFFLPIHPLLCTITWTVRHCEEYSVGNKEIYFSTNFYFNFLRKTNRKSYTEKNLRTKNISSKNPPTIFLKVWKGFLVIFKYFFLKLKIPLNYEFQSDFSCARSHLTWNIRQKVGKGNPFAHYYYSVGYIAA